MGLGKKMFVSEAPLDVAVLERNLKNMENILQDTRKLIKEYNTLRQYKIQLKSLKETGDIRKERAEKRKRDQEDEDEKALAGPSLPKQLI